MEGVELLRLAHGSHRITCSSQFLFSVMQIPGIEFGPIGFQASAIQYCE